MDGNAVHIFYLYTLLFNGIATPDHDSHIGGGLDPPAIDGCQILVVSHGLFCRVLQAACLGLSIRAVPRMDNAEVRRVRLSLPLPETGSTEESGATAN